MTKIGNYCQFNPLKEVWIGGTYPEKFYEIFDNKTEDVFCQITEITQQDLKNLVSVLENLDIKVVVPEFSDNVGDYMDSAGNLLKPPMAPCDWAITIDDTLYITPQWESGVQPYQHAIDRYKDHGQKVNILDRSSDDPMPWLAFPTIARMGRDLFIDYDPHNATVTEKNLQVAKLFSEKHRVHISTTGDHSDGVFCPLKPGYIFSTHYRTHYAESFPGWEIFRLPEPKSNGHSLKWWVPGIDYTHFNDGVLSVAEAWLGNPNETVFEVNMIVVDDKNIVCAAQDDRAFKFFESIGVTPHVVNFRTCAFWDAGLHCLSSDVYREGGEIDYWPDRGPNGIYRVSEI